MSVCKIINCDSVKKITEGFKDKLPETLEEVFVWKFYRSNEVKPDELSDEAKQNLKFIEHYFSGVMYDLGIWHAYPNGVVCKTTGIKGEREEASHNNLLAYYPVVTKETLLFYAKFLHEGKLSSVFESFKQKFNELSSVEFTALSDDELLFCLEEAVGNFNSIQKVNEPRLKLEVNGEDFKCFLDNSDVINIPRNMTLDYRKMKQEKESLQDYPNKYLTKKLLGFAVSNSIINDWEYKFYLDILSKPKPRKLSSRQADLYKKINRKIQYAL